MIEELLQRWTIIGVRKTWIKKVKAHAKANGFTIEAALRDLTKDSLK